MSATFSDADKKTFWEHKILQWEQGRYNPKRSKGGVLEWFADRASDSLRFRLESAGEIVGGAAAGKRVVDLGCGSGKLAEAVFAHGATSYVGYDIAESAVNAARAWAADKPWASRARFEVARVTDLKDLEADVVCSFGLLDWLTDAELDHLFKISGQADFVHAIAERRPTVERWVHATYCYVAYGYRTAGYVPRYYDVRALGALIRRNRKGLVRVWRHPRLSFGAYLTSLPIGDVVVG
jgi:predicted RNA methylase